LRENSYVFWRPLKFFASSPLLLLEVQLGNAYMRMTFMSESLLENLIEGENEMPVAAQLKNYLDKRHIKYDVITPPKTETSHSIAEAAHIPEDKVMKSVLLRCEDGYLLTVIPSTHRIQLEKLRAIMDKPLDLAKEREVGSLFTDCELGAIPVAGNAYGLPVLFDDAIYDADDVYFDAGDHESLIHLSAGAFTNLMSTAEHARFSYRM